jgi:Acyl-coenzyme A oxidase N-terminal
MSTNLAEERAALPFSLDELSHFIYGSKEELELFLKYQSVINKEPIHQHDPDHYSLSREAKIRNYIKRFHHFHKQFDFNKPESLLMSFAFFSEPLVTSLHQAMFIPCLKHLSTPKQYEKW